MSCIFGLSWTAFAQCRMLELGLRLEVEWKWVGKPADACMLQHSSCLYLPGLPRPVLKRGMASDIKAHAPLMHPALSFCGGGFTLHGHIQLLLKLNHDSIFSLY